MADDYSVPISMLEDFFFNLTETLVQQIQNAKSIGNMPFVFSPSLFHFYDFFFTEVMRKYRNSNQIGCILSKVVTLTSISVMGFAAFFVSGPWDPTQSVLFPRHIRFRAHVLCF